MDGLPPAGMGNNNGEPGAAVQVPLENAVRVENRLSVRDLALLHSALILIPDIRVRRRIQLQLVLHAQQCQRREAQAPSGAVTCSDPNCRMMKGVLTHIRNCQQPNCTFQHCRTTQQILLHWNHCIVAECPFCSPLRNRERDRNNNPIRTLPFETEE